MDVEKINDELRSLHGQELKSIPGGLVYVPEKLDSTFLRELNIRGWEIIPPRKNLIERLRAAFICLFR